MIILFHRKWFDLCDFLLCHFCCWFCWSFLANESPLLTDPPPRCSVIESNRLALGDGGYIIDEIETEYRICSNANRFLLYISDMGGLAPLNQS